VSTSRTGSLGSPWMYPEGVTIATCIRPRGRASDYVRSYWRSALGVDSPFSTSCRDTDMDRHTNTTIGRQLLDRLGVNPYNIGQYECETLCCEHCGHWIGDRSGGQSYWDTRGGSCRDSIRAEFPVYNDPIQDQC
jgi:hypothetical protein